MLPGGIDSHVHFAQPSGAGIVMADDFESGTRSAAFGGNTLVMPFCMQEKGQSLRAALNAYHDKARAKCYIDTSFHLVISDPTPQVLGQELPAAVDDGYTSFKVSFDDLRGPGADRLPDAGGVRRSLLLNPVPSSWCTRRTTTPSASSPPGSRRRTNSRRNITAPRGLFPSSARRRTARISLAEYDRRADHDSARVERRGDGADPLGAGQRPQGIRRDLPAVSRPDREGHGRPQHGGRQVRVLAAAARRSLAEGVLARARDERVPGVRPTTVRSATTTPPASSTRKGRTSFRWVPNGIPGVETRLPILFSKASSKDGSASTSSSACRRPNHARMYGLHPRKGTIAVGSDADIAIWDPAKKVTLDGEDLHDCPDYIRPTRASRSPAGR